MKFITIVLLASTIGCGTSNVEGFEQCSIDALAVPANGAPGSTVVLIGGPFGESWDNLVQIDGALADVSSTEQSLRFDASDAVVELNACDTCNTCRERETGHCNRCDRACLNCIETLSFTVPNTSTGVKSLQVINRWGSSGDVQFQVLPASTTIDTSVGGTGTPTGGTGTPTGGSGATPMIGGSPARLPTLQSVKTDRTNP